MSQPRAYRHLDTITAFFVAVLIISNVAAAKIVGFGPFAFDAATLLFPLSYIFGDVLTEVYGYKRSRKVIWLGFGTNIFMATIFMLVAAMPAAAGWPFQKDFMNILGQTPRIVLASVIAFFAGEFSNSYVLAKMKVKMEGKQLWMRTIGSTIVGEGVDSLLFVVIAFYGVLPNSLVSTMIMSNYIIKVGVEVIFTPVTYWVVGFLKKQESEDYYDRDTNFNPFVMTEAVGEKSNA